MTEGHEDPSKENNMGKVLHSPAQMQGISYIKLALVVSSPFGKSKKKTEMKPDKTYQEKLKNRNPGALDQAEVLKGTLLWVKINNVEDLGLKTGVYKVHVYGNPGNQKLMTQWT